MLTHKIIKYKPVIQLTQTRPHKAPNKSFITSQEILDTFLERQPKVGDWLYRSLANDGTTNLVIDHKSGVTKVISVVSKFEDLSFDWQTGFPLTHRVITLFAGALNPWIRLEDITRYSPLPEHRRVEWVDDNLQNTFKEAILRTAN